MSMISGTEPAGGSDVPVGREGTAAPLSYRRARCRIAAAGMVALCVAGASGVFLLMRREDPRAPVQGFVYVLAVPLLMALAYAAVSLVAGLTWPRVSGARRRARLRARGLRDVVGRPALIVHLTGVGVFGLIVVVGAALSRDGMTLAWGWNERSGTYLGVVTNTTFPGLRVTIPLVMAAVATLVLAWWCVLVVLHRPDVVTAECEADRSLRRVSAGQVLRVTAAGFLATDGALVVLAGAAVVAAFRDTWVGTVGSVAACFGVGLAVVGLVVAVVPVDRARPVAPRSVAAEAADG